MGRSKQMKRKGRKREEKKRIRIPSINSLPSELMTEILGRVAAYSFSDLLNAKSSCKFFHEAATDNYIFQRLSLEMVPVVLWHTRNEVSRLLERCKKSGNPEALYRQGVVDYFSLRSPSPESGLETLKKAAKMGHKGAMYVLAVVLLSSDDDYFRREGVELLREIEKSKARDCRDDLGAIVGAIWVRNPFDPKWRSSSYCNEQGVEHRRSRPGWESDDDDSVRCHACRCDREVACVMDMFSYI